jgi:tetratricopeptide (TPR) repeat protein
MPFVGAKTFETLSSKAMVLNVMNKTADADAVMSEAVRLPGVSVQEVHEYGRSLLAANRNDKALEIFKLNRKLHPDDKFTTYVGLARAYTALNDKKNAVTNWEMAIKNIPESQKANLAFYEGELKKLKA